MVPRSRVAATLLAAIGLSLLTATPALADDDSNFGSGVDPANNWNFSAASVCFQELAVVPVGGPFLSPLTNSCLNGNVLNHQ